MVLKDSVKAESLKNFKKIDWFSEVKNIKL